MILRTNSGPLYYELSGDGPPLVFVSGWAMSSECWRPAVAALQKRHRCLTFDSRGITRSQPMSNNARFEIEDHADDLHAILEFEGIFDAVMVGHELGSLIATACADRHPQDARSMILVSPRAVMRESEIRSLALFTPAALALRELASYPLIRNVVAWRFRRAPQPYRDRLFEDFADLNPRAAYETAVAASSKSPERIERWISRNESPVLIVCGDRDQKSVTQARRLFATSRRGKIATMSDCGFLPMLEYPRQFARLIDDFIVKTQGIRRTGLSLRKR